MTKSIKISWEQFETDIEFLASKMFDRKFTKIVAVTRGGLIPAYYLAKLLDIRYIDTAGAMSYEGKNQMKVKGIKVPTTIYDSDVLIVDDLIDTGDTIKLIAGNNELGAAVAVLYEKESSPKGLSDYHARRYLSDPWIEFPYE